jgi:L-asparagine transporter-like permease
VNSKTVTKAFLPLLLIFIITTIVIVATPSLEFLWGMKKNVMLIGNIILFIATAFSFYLYQQSLQSKNVQASFRMIYGGMLAKMMICLFTALIYIMIAKKNVSKGGIFGCMFLYFLYTFVEVSIIMRLSSKIKNAKERGAA